MPQVLHRKPPALGPAPGRGRARGPAPVDGLEFVMRAISRKPAPRLIPPHLSENRPRFHAPKLDCQLARAPAKRRHGNRKQNETGNNLHGSYGTAVLGAHPFTRGSTGRRQTFSVPQRNNPALTL